MRGGAEVTIMIPQQAPMHGDRITARRAPITWGSPSALRAVFRDNTAEKGYASRVER
jgi:hypothetical protein